MKNRLWNFGLVLCLLAVSGYTTTAQEAADTDIGWPIEQQCAGQPTPPPEGWTFEGTIFTRGGDGVHAVRADMATPYYIAFQSDTEFGAMGALSPDGSWFAVPAGQTRNDVRRLLIFFNIRELRVYSTDGKRELHQVEGTGKADYGMSAFYAVTPPQWIDNQHLIYYDYGNPQHILLINPFTGEVESWRSRRIDPLLSFPSPDRTRAHLCIARAAGRYNRLGCLRPSG